MTRCFEPMGMCQYCNSNEIENYYDVHFCLSRHNNCGKFWMFERKLFLHAMRLQTRRRWTCEYLQADEPTQLARMTQLLRVANAEGGFARNSTCTNAFCSHYVFVGRSKQCSASPGDLPQTCVDHRFAARAHQSVWQQGCRVRCRVLLWRTSCLRAKGVFACFPASIWYDITVSEMKV